MVVCTLTDTPSRSRLDAETLHCAPSDIRTPRYDRAQTTPGIVHLGLGAFHRAHQAVFVDDCLVAGDRSWAIIAASLRSATQHDALHPQDGLYSFVVRENDREEVRVIGAITRTLVAPRNPAELITAIADPHTRLVTLTITEKGYCCDLPTSSLRVGDADIQHDIANPATPRSALGFLAAALRDRMRAKTAPPTLLSCDNLPNNGALLRKLLIEFASLQDAALARFIDSEVATPSCMVDRIVPATTPEDRERVSNRLGLCDEGVVVSEPFYQWVIEDHFPTGRPEFERSGMVFVKDVAPFEQMKLRLLNGAHSAIAAIGRTSGFATVADAILQPEIVAFIKAYWVEVAQTLTQQSLVPDYTRQLLLRFSNKALHHKTAQIATDGSQKVPQRMLAPLHDLRARGRPAPCLVFAIAAWLRSCEGVDELGQPMPLNDPVLTRWTLRPTGNADSQTVVAAYLRDSSVFDPSLASDESFARTLIEALSAIRAKGVLTALQKFLNSSADNASTIKPRVQS